MSNNTCCGLCSDVCHKDAIVPPNFDEDEAPTLPYIRAQKVPDFSGAPATIPAAKWESDSERRKASEADTLPAPCPDEEEHFHEEKASLGARVYVIVGICLLGWSMMYGIAKVLFG